MEGSEQMNLQINGWAKDTTQHLKDRFEVLKIVHRDNSPSAAASRESLVNKFAHYGGMINKVGFTFPRHMVFVAKGVGRGVPISRAGSPDTSRVPKDWFNAVIDEDIENLADIVANGNADLVVNNLKIR